MTRRTGRGYGRGMLPTSHLLAFTLPRGDQGRVRDWLARSPRRLEALGGTGGVAMIAIGTRLALTGRHD